MRYPFHPKPIKPKIIAPCSMLHQNEGGIGKSIPDAREISQYLTSFGGVGTFLHQQSFYMEWIRKSFPVDREGLTVLKSILPADDERMRRPSWRLCRTRTQKWNKESRCTQARLPLTSSLHSGRLKCTNLPCN